MAHNSQNTTCCILIGDRCIVLGTGVLQWHSYVQCTTYCIHACSYRTLGLVICLWILFTLKACYKCIFNIITLQPYFVSVFVILLHSNFPHFSQSTPTVGKQRISSVFSILMHWCLPVTYSYSKFGWRGGCVGSVSARSLQTEPTARLWVRVHSTDVYCVISLGKIFTPTRLG